MLLILCETIPCTFHGAHASRFCTLIRHIEMHAQHLHRGPLQSDLAAPTTWKHRITTPILLIIVQFTGKVADDECLDGFKGFLMIVES